jgi:ABC-type glycerol-3-phosphate transport system substrate-binding protein
VKQVNNPLDGARTDRRRFLGLAGLGAIAIAGGGAVAGCSTTKSSSGPGTTSQSELQKILPAYVPTSSIKPDIPGVTGATGFSSDPVFLSYPASPVQTVTGVPGKGGSYSTITPLWGAIPPSSGNSYYQSVNQALGATLKIQPSDGNNYQTMLPTLFAASKLPDWIQIPGWNMPTLGFSDAVTKFADLGPYLSGDKVKAYPNLAAIPSSAWQACIWNGKLYGLPVYPSGATIPGTYFYRKDIFAQLGINPDSVKSPDDLAALGAQLTSASAGRWAFDDLWPYLGQIFKYPSSVSWGIDADGKIYHKYESAGMLEALNWEAKLVKAGYVHPDAVAGNSQNAKQRFWSGKVVVTGDGPGAWKGDDAKSGAAANPSYNRQAFKLLSVDGKPTIEMNPSAGMYSFLNAKLSADQIKECLSIANYLAAPYGSAEWLTVNFGPAGTDYTMIDGNPQLTERGSKEVATTFQFLVTPLTPTTVISGYTQVAKDYAAWEADMVKYSVKPAFYAMNITEPVQYAKIGQAVEDILIDVRFGRKPISAFQDAVKTWQSQGGNALRAFYEDIRTKNGTGQ